MKQGATSSPVFVHAFWRTGGTYLWKKFRDQEQYRAYYEPFHESLLTLPRPPERVDPSAALAKAKRLRHPVTESSYFVGYPYRPGGGVEGFQRYFPYESYCLDADSPDDALERYLTRLISYAREHDQVPMFKFTRSLLRAHWLAVHFEARNLLVLRRPLDVWRSMISSPRNYYLAALCCAVGQNRGKSLLLPIAQEFTIPEFRGDSLEADLRFYRDFAHERLPQLYPFFYQVYILSLIYSLPLMDAVIDMNEASGSDDAKLHIMERLQALGISLDLRDLCLAPLENNHVDEAECMDHEQRGREALLTVLPRAWRLSPDTLSAHSASIGPYFSQVFSLFTAEGPGVEPGPPSISGARC
jgi:hypothetical protein